MFEDFDFGLLDTSEFKEDSVREEILLPILKALGFSASGPNKIFRSKNLIHPYVMIGSRKHKINIIPDYVLKSENGNKIVIEAKGPNEKISNSEHVEQTYSYAIHPEIRANLYALCNGREFVIHHINQFEPIVKFNIKETNNYIGILKSKLFPDNKVDTSAFMPDFGMYLEKSNFDKTIDWTFVGAILQHIAKINEDLYTASSTVGWGETVFAISFDFNKKIYNDLFESASERMKEELNKATFSQPFHGLLPSKEEIIVAARLGTLQKGIYEEFIPFNVSRFEKMRGGG